ncbi:CHASE2 domain-containing protein [Candidatus Electronema sp. JC]|uniref:CHASE2 domain-containing protein n=1 Tax=Candidatus Electronema sp. JC TaxID=3401570 RepID=UPI003B43C77B
MAAAGRKRCGAAQLARMVGAAASLALTLVSFFDPPLLEELRLKSFDLLLRQLPAPLAKPPVVIVDIDPRSLARFGQWPWPRSRTAELISRIAAARPKVIGLDIVFAEPDRSSPARLAEEADATAMPAAARDYLNRLPDPDQVLAKTLADSPAPVILGHLFTSRGAVERKTAEPRSGGFLLKDHDPVPFLHQFAAADTNLPLLERAAQGSGFFNIVPDKDAIVRRLPLLISFNGEPNPSLTLAMLRAAEGGAAPVVVESNENGVRTVQVGPHRIPTTRRGEMLVNFSKSAHAEDQVDPVHRLAYLSAADLLDGALTSAELALLRDAYVIVGTSALGLFDLIAVPVSEVFPGVEFHAQALNTILTGSFLHRPEWIRGLELVQLAALGLLLALLLPRTGAAVGGLLTFAAAAGCIVFSVWMLERHRFLVDMVTPVAASLLLFSVLTFINYFVEEKEAQRLRSAFAQYLSPEVVEELVKNQDSVVLTGEERELTILFSDIRSFTSMAERMRPEALCAFLNEYLTPMTAAVMNRRGTVDKFIGDAVMAFWNAPLTTPSHARHACECALAMLNELEALNLSWLKRGLPAIRIGIGIHCGMARVGNMGSQQRFEYTVIGDTVNLASRLEGLTKLYGAEIIVSGAVFDALEPEGQFLFRRVDTVRVVGKSEPVAIYQLLGEREHIVLTEKFLLHNAALALYSSGDFHEAGQLFARLAEQQPEEDKLCKLYIERCRLLAENPPPHWDGITDLRSK